MRNFIDIVTLLEDRREGLMSRFVPIMMKNTAWHTKTRGIDPDFGLATKEVAEMAIGFILAADPDPRHRYASWVILRFSRGDFLLEDAPRVFGSLATYDEAKRSGIIPKNHDIGSIKLVTDLYAMVAGLLKTGDRMVPAGYEDKIAGQCDLILNTDRVLITIPKTMEAAQWLGRDTEWCTAYGGKYSRYPDRESLFPSYEYDPLFFIKDKISGDVYQFSFENNQYMDRNDNEINMRGFCLKYPEVVRALASEFNENKNLPLSACPKDMYHEFNGFSIATEEDVAIACKELPFETIIESGLSVAGLKIVYYQHPESKIKKIYCLAKYGKLSHIGKQPSREIVLEILNAKSFLYRGRIILWLIQIMDGSEDYYDGVLEEYLTQKKIDLYIIPRHKISPSVIRAWMTCEYPAAWHCEAMTKDIILSVDPGLVSPLIVNRILMLRPDLIDGQVKGWCLKVLAHHGHKPQDLLINLG